MTRFEALTAITARHQTLAAENYDRVRALAEHVRTGFCEYLEAPGGDCVLLVPPLGPFDPKNYGDEAFSMAPTGFRQIAPIVFGLAVRATAAGDWMRLVMQCSKQGEAFQVDFADGQSHAFDMPFETADHVPFFNLVFEHLLDGFREQTRQYEEGDYGSRAIGFEFNGGLYGTAPVNPVVVLAKPAAPPPALRKTAVEANTPKPRKLKPGGAGRKPRRN
ncbi:MAG: hypothetical protein SGJ21_10870 [Alphaproteobacteria bacterium]|nr:hypothetical protein [Alphaproteobacteria bacterium]